MTPPPEQHVLGGGWVFEENLRPLCRLLSDLVGYDFDDSDWQAVEYGLSTTDDDRAGADWFLYPLVGRGRVDVRMARSAGGSVVSVQLLGAADEVLEAQVEVLIRFLSEHYAHDRPAP
ncbi:hypothetical protein ACFWVC_06100 [Streptomyces sp. NPDC058691]|uniref:hypothetical protein n=1 Tax=Streptomyces sp. NPDC058691 TaxID=3346601 RepID=UPI00365B6A41